MTTTYDLIDEAVIDAPAAAVWDALIAEFRGARAWWVPANTFTTRAGSPDTVGGEVEVTVHTRGVDKGGLKLRFTARTTAVVPQRRLETAYTDGGFRGRATFTLDPLDGGRTRLAMHFDARPHGGLRLLAKAVDLGAEHSKAALAAFAALNRHLSAGVPA